MSGPGDVRTRASFPWPWCTTHDLPATPTSSGFQCPVVWGFEASMGLRAYQSCDFEEVRIIRVTGKRWVGDLVVESVKGDV